MKPLHLPPSATHRLDRWRVRIEPIHEAMRGPGIAFASDRLWPAMQADETATQIAAVACLPGLVGASLAMPDAHQGYGFPIGGVAATDAAGEGVISPGGVGFDINCGVRLLVANRAAGKLKRRKEALLAAIFARVPVGVGHGGGLELSARDMEAVLARGAAWAVAQGYGEDGDLECCEAGGAMREADPEHVSERARARGASQLGTLGSGNHFVELQAVDQIFDATAAAAMGLEEGGLTALVHTGSRGLGHQVCTDHVAALQQATKRYGFDLPDRQLACAPLSSPEGRAYLGAMAASANFAWANRQLITHALRQALAEVLGDDAHFRLVYDLAHNVAKLERHQVGGRERLLCVHRKGATRAFPAGHPEVPERYRAVGQPVFIPGSMGTASYVLVGTPEALTETWGSVCHGAGRARSRTATRKRLDARQVLAALAAKDIAVQAGSQRGLVEEAPEAYKDVDEVVETVVGAGLARRVARLRPIAVIKG
ncbi:MAG: RtcB family protein [Pseudomonadota bacterium]